MDAIELREAQRPLKQRYREDPATALVPASAEARIDVAGQSCRIVTPAGGVDAGLHAAAGGSGAMACSADLLLQALAACAGVTFAAIATARSIVVRSATVHVEGHWDARGTLGVDREAPVGMTDIELRFVVDTDADDETLERIIAVTEDYCVIAQTLIEPPRIGFSFARATASG
jgi:uncharacterized OsmC-like protein